MNQKIIRLKNKKFTLPEVFRFFNDFRFYDAVDYRKPLAGEWFVSGAIPQAYQAIHNLSAVYLVIKPTNKGSAR